MCKRKENPSPKCSGWIKLPIDHICEYSQATNGIEVELKLEKKKNMWMEMLRLNIQILPWAFDFFCFEDELF